MTVSIGSGNGLTPKQWKAITWPKWQITNAFLHSHALMYSKKRFIYDDRLLARLSCKLISNDDRHVLHSEIESDNKGDQSRLQEKLSNCVII